MTQTAPASPTDQASPKKVRKPRTPPTVPGEGSFAPIMPTNSRDILAVWALPVQALREGRLKITRNQYATNVKELIRECSVEDYDLKSIARDFGPGDYFLYLSPSPQRTWGMHNCKISVAPEYAESAGYQMYPIETRPRVVDTAQLSQVATAMQSDKPLTVGDMTLLIKTVVDEVRRSEPQPSAPVVPMGMSEMMGLWESLGKIQREAEDRALRLTRRLEPEPRNDDEGDSITGMLMKALPAFLTAFTPRPQPAQAPPVVLNPSPDPPQEEPPMTISVPLTQEEASRFSSGIAMLRPFAGTIVAMMERTTDDAAIAQELASYVPGRLEEQLIDLASLVDERGNAVLGIIDPRLQTVRGANVMRGIARVLTQPE